MDFLESFNGTCPVCGKPLKNELGVLGLKVADLKGRQKPKFAIFNLILRAADKYVEQAAFNMIFLPRPEYVICLNDECPAHYKAIPILFHPPFAGIGKPTLRGDFINLNVMMKNAQFKKRKAEIERLKRKYGGE